MTDSNQNPEQESQQTQEPKASAPHGAMIQERLQQFFQCASKKAPVLLKKSLILAGNGAEALSKALHKMSDMVRTEETPKADSEHSEAQGPTQ